MEKDSTSFTAASSLPLWTPPPEGKPTFPTSTHRWGSGSRTRDQMVHLWLLPRGGRMRLHKAFCRRRRTSYRMSRADVLAPYPDAELVDGTLEIRK